VPAGLTKFRDGLYPLESFTPEECSAVIDQVEAFGDKCLKAHGTRLFYPADELYIKSGRELPDDSFYEEYSQIENGVGMLTELGVEIKDELDFADEYKFKAPRTVSIATGYASYKHISEYCRAIEKRFEGVTVHVYPIKNNFFGEEITVSGLLTATDMQEQLLDKELGDALLIPSATLRAEGDLFLDGKTPEELSEALGVELCTVDNTGEDFVRAVLGI
jgi:NifB/MoaA-like Fe-S oxidoreductase